MSSFQKIKNASVLLASGGTGGHVFPGLHIANSLKENGCKNIYFLGVGRPAEDTILANTEFKRYKIETSGIKGTGILGLLKFLISFPKAFFKTWQLFKEIRPNVVIATGGYTSFFPVLIAFLKRIPCILHEAEKNFGVANRFLSILATRVTLAHPDTKCPIWAKVQFTGHPIRPSLKKIRRMDAIVEAPKKLLIVGGSQGARSLDLLGQDLAEFFKLHNLEILHQARRENIESLSSIYKNYNLNFKVVEFISDMDQALAWSDIIISRAGAGMVSEIATSNRPAILIPYPFAQGDHQTANAEKLVKTGKAFIVKEDADIKDSVVTHLNSLLVLDEYNRIVALPYEDSNLNATDNILKIVQSLL